MSLVTSEIYQENNLQAVELKNTGGKCITKFQFTYPNNDHTYTVDEDGDLIVQRRNRTIDCNTKQYNVIEVEHYVATEIALVGLQVWRGALFLADYLFHKRSELLHNKQILELGAGVGLTSIAAAIYARKIYCTDIDVGGILDLIIHNIQRNTHLFPRKSNNNNNDKTRDPLVHVIEYDFKQNFDIYSKQLLQAIDSSDVVIAADVIYDNELTDAFINVIETIFKREYVTGHRKVILIAFEKRYVFTKCELDTIAPMFEYFIQQTMKKNWHFEYIASDFPQYFHYERNKHLMLLQLTSKN